MASIGFKRTASILGDHPWYLALTWGVLVGLFLFLGHQGPNIQPDTGSYLTASAVRSALYPLLLKLNSWLFGPNNFQLLVLAQLAYGILGSIFLAHKIRKLFGLNLWAIPPLLLCLLAPYYGPGRFGNSVMTEALCYPTFLLASACLFEGVIGKNSRHLLYFLGLTAILILTRRQFLFLYPVFGLLLVYLVLCERKAFKLGLLTVAFIGSIIFTHLLERTYQYFTQGNFSTIPFTGIQLIVAPMYIAKDSDIQLFDTDLERRIFKDIRQQLQQKKLSFTALNKTSFFDFSVYANFYENYNAICWETISPTFSKNGIGDPYQLDTMTRDMAIKLIHENWQPYLTLYLLNIVFNVGGLYYCLLLAILGLFALIQHYQYRDALSLGCLLALTLSAANYSLVALVEPVLRRYSAYTDGVQVGVLLACIMLAFQVWHVRYRR